MFQLHNIDKSSSGIKEMMSPLFSLDSIPLGGLNSGVPTRTTATLTPTTLRNIEQTCIEIQCQVESHQNEAGFVPPVVQTSNQGLFMSVVDTKSWQGGSTRISEPSRLLGSSILDSDKQILASMSPPKRSTGGRKPNKDIDVSPEEVERRAVRRERNKMAAARCRKRRLDHTNELVEETEELEEKKQVLQSEIQILQQQKEELEYILENHKPCCRLKPPCSPPDIKPFISGNGNIINISEGEVKKPVSVAISLKQNVLVTSRSCVSNASKRPDSLPVFPPPMTADGVPLPTPTTGINFNFDSLMDGGTGLTPVSTPLIPTCSSQQRNSGLSSPDSNKLVSL